jgi:Na+/H+-dicarboxylate symporter
VQETVVDAPQPRSSAPRVLTWWHGVPCSTRVLGALVLGTALGALLGPRAMPLRQPGDLILRLVHGASPILVLVVLLHALSRTEVRTALWLRTAGHLTVNTLAAALIGLGVGNLVRPGRWAPLLSDGERPTAQAWPAFFHALPTNVSGPLAHHDVLATLVIAIAIGLALRKVRRERGSEEQTRALDGLLDTATKTVGVLLEWILDLIPVALLCSVATAVGEHGLAVFRILAAFSATVLLGLLLLTGYYAIRLRLGSRVHFRPLLQGGRTAFLAAFSTASSTVALPMAYRCLKEEIGVREEAASLGALVGANLSKDGTVLYLAVAALFTAQMGGGSAGLVTQVQILMVLASFLVRTVTPGVQGGGIATMTMVFGAVGLPLGVVPLLLSVDWLLERCRTAVNVLGDMTVACLLDGKQEKEERDDETR